MDTQDIRKAVKEGYARIAKREVPCCTDTSCCTPPSSCCGPAVDTTHTTGRKIGYTDEEMQSVPEGSNLGLGCGNPTALASLQEGETVLDLGSGAGFDCFLAAQRVGKKGKVIGVDMTPEMIGKAKENARKGGFKNIEFKLGEIEHLPVTDNLIDVVISNCVINLSPDKEGVFREMYRVLKPGGRFYISDIVTLNQLPGVVVDSVAAYIGCVAGAIVKMQYIKAIETAGFREVTILKEDAVPLDCLANDPALQAMLKDADIGEDEFATMGNSVRSILITGKKVDDKQ